MDSTDVLNQFYNQLQDLTNIEADVIGPDSTLSAFQKSQYFFALHQAQINFALAQEKLLGRDTDILQQISREVGNVQQQITRSQSNLDALATDLNQITAVLGNLGTVLTALP